MQRRRPDICQPRRCKFFFWLTCSFKFVYVCFHVAKKYQMVDACTQEQNSFMFLILLWHCIAANWLPRLDWWPCFIYTIWRHKFLKIRTGVHRTCPCRHLILVMLSLGWTETFCLTLCMFKKLGYWYDEHKHLKASLFVLTWSWLHMCMGNPGLAITLAYWIHMRYEMSN